MRLARSLALCLLLAVPGRALAWGNEGHRIIALIAQSELKPEVKEKVDALLATDTSQLTGHDIASEATWADAWREDGHRETALWHYADVELDHPNLEQACYGYPALTGPAAQGGEQDCVVAKVDQFRKELADPATAPAERLLALKYLLHFVGDMHQPLHLTDNHDHGGNCLRIAQGSHGSNLHAYWDTTLVEAIGLSAPATAARLEAEVTPEERTAWSQGDLTHWALDTYLVGRRVAYAHLPAADCAMQQSGMSLPPDYQTTAKAAAEIQLEKAGVRLAAVLNQALGT
jgi:hypothetical protein